MATPINSTEAARLIEAGTGRRCSRQNLEKHCDRGALRDSPCILQAKPLRVDADTVVAEFRAKVAPHQAEAVQPRAKRAALDRAATPAPSPLQSSAPPPPSDGPPPDYAESRARSEFEKANLLELERKTKEGLLLQREEVERSQAMAINISKTRLLGVPSTAKQRIPHLTLDEVEILTGLIREALEELAGWEVTT